MYCVLYSLHMTIPGQINPKMKTCQHEEFTKAQVTESSHELLRPPVAAHLRPPVSVLLVAAHLRQPVSVLLVAAHLRLRLQRRPPVSLQRRRPIQWLQAGSEPATVEEDLESAKQLKELLRRHPVPFLPCWRKLLSESEIFLLHPL